MARRTATPPNPDAPDITDTPPEDMPAVPPGVDADVTVRYKSRVRDKEKPHDDDRELRELAATMEDDNPPDPLSEFLETWANYVGYNCMALRLPDPSTRRMPGQTYNRPHFGQPENLGAVTFDPNPINFINSLQIVNGNSGGCFQIWLMDNSGGRVANAVLYSVAIADPPKTERKREMEQLLTAPQIQAPRPQSDSERKLEETKDRLFNTALERALNPVAAAPALGGNNLSSEDNAALFLLSKTDFLGSIFGKLSSLAEQAATVTATKEPTIKDRALDAAVNIITNNPAIVERLSATFERIVARVLPDPRIDTPAPPYYYPPQQQPGAPQPPPSAPTQPAQPGTEYQPDTPNPNDELTISLEDDDLMTILDELTALLNSNEPLTLDSPVIAELLKDYPVKARIALRTIASESLDDIIEWIKDTGGPLYVSLLDGPASGPFLRERLAAFKQVCETAQAQVKAKQQPAAASAPETAPETAPEDAP